MIFNLISGPRNISTAIMYSFAQRSDMAVIDEPFYALYLHKTGLSHPGRKEVLESQSADELIVRKQISSSSDSAHIFVKNMAHHMEVLGHPFLENSLNIFLIRDPKQIIASYREVIDNPVMRDIGIEFQYVLFQQLIAVNKSPVVVDSGILLQNPEGVLRQLCHACAIGFESSMLRWPSGPKPFDGVWARYWYKNVHASTGFKSQGVRDRDLPGNLGDLYERAKNYYEKLLPFSLKA